MGYNVTGLPAYTNQESRVFIARSILGVATIAMLTQYGSFDPTAKGSEAVMLIDTDVTIQDGTNCGRTPLGGATLGEAVLTVNPMKVNQDYCTRDLEKVWAVEELKAIMKGQVYTEALFMTEIGNLNADKVALKLEQMIWKGDKTSADLSLKRIDGFIKQIKAGAYVNLNVAGGDDGLAMIPRLRKIFKAVAIEVSMAPDFRIMLGQDDYNQYIAELADKNLYKPNDDKTLFGTTAILVPLPGLNGTHVIVATRVRNLRAGGEMTEATFTQKYSVETELVYMDSRFSLGVVPIYLPEIYLGDYTPA